MNTQKLAELKEIFITSNHGQIALIKAILDGGGIPYIVQGEQFNALRAPIPVRFLVPEEYFDHARALLDELFYNKK